jgi:hypothetical protein
MTKSWVYLLCAMLGCFITACTPALNWREVRFDAGDVQALMPCKPDQAMRQIFLQEGSDTVPANLQLQGCEASDLQFTFAQITLPSGVLPTTALTAWRQASLAPLAVPFESAQSRDWALTGALTIPQAIRVQVKNGPYQAQLGWFARGNKLYQVAVYGAAQTKSFDDTAEVYFSGIKLP